ncbi:MAG: hypothetical protein SO253_03650 [Bacilli bacterium]|nr:hypothetical protein [Bacilli bacterium]
MSEKYQRWIKYLLAIAIVIIANRVVYKVIMEELMGNVVQNYFIVILGASSIIIYLIINYKYISAIIKEKFSYLNYVILVIGIIPFIFYLIY